MSEVFLYPFLIAAVTNDLQQSGFHHYQLTLQLWKSEVVLQGLGRLAGLSDGCFLCLFVFLWVAGRESLSQGALSGSQRLPAFHWLWPPFTTYILSTPSLRLALLCLPCEDPVPTPVPPG